MSTSSVVFWVGWMKDSLYDRGDCRGGKAPVSQRWNLLHQLFYSGGESFLKRFTLVTNQ